MTAHETPKQITKRSPGAGGLRTLALVLIAATSIAACGSDATTPEDEVRAWVWKGQELAESKDRRALVKMLSPAYADARGNSRDDIEDLFRLVFLRQNKVALITRIDEVAVHDGTAANLSIDVAMAGSDNNVLGFSADAYQFAMELEKDGDDWLLISARWARVGRELQ